MHLKTASECWPRAAELDAEGERLGWPRGACLGPGAPCLHGNSKDSTLSHPVAGGLCAVPICRFFQSSQCMMGDTCVFRHLMVADEAMPVRDGTLLDLLQTVCVFTDLFVARMSH